MIECIAEGLSGDKPIFLYFDDMGDAVTCLAWLRTLGCTDAWLLRVLGGGAGRGCNRCGRLPVLRQDEDGPGREEAMTEPRLMHWNELTAEEMRRVSEIAYRHRQGLVAELVLNFWGPKTYAAVGGALSILFASSMGRDDPEQQADQARVLNEILARRHSGCPWRLVPTP